MTVPASSGQQLDLFSPDVLPPPPVLPDPVKADEAPAADDSPAQRPPRAQPPAKKRHIVLNDKKIEYDLVRTNRRTIGLTVSEHGLRITAPRSITIKAVEKAIRQKEKWITEKLGFFLDFSEAADKKRAVSFSDGDILYLLGEPYTLRLHTGPGESVSVDEAAKEFRVTTANIARRLAVRELLMIWFSRKAYEVFSSRAPHYSSLLNLPYRALSLSSAKSRWGSCSSKGHIRLNWRLIHFQPELIDYVIVHELAHLREMNHSKRFWEIVSTVFPDYKATRKTLHQQSRLLGPVW